MYCRNNNDHHDNNGDGNNIMYAALQHEKCVVVRIYEPPLKKQRTINKG